ncbi:MAG: hypothetical protein M1269_08905 [Chloroflexi bacterium]|nr:hypothetical protein [Chloroflexota bacterium]
MNRKTLVIAIGVLLIFTFMLSNAAPAHAGLLSSFFKNVFGLNIDINFSKSSESYGLSKTNVKDSSGNKIGTAWTISGSGISINVSITKADKSSSSQVTSEGQLKYEEKHKGSKDKDGNTNSQGNQTNSDHDFGTGTTGGQDNIVTTTTTPTDTDTQPGQPPVAAPYDDSPIIGYDLNGNPITFLQYNTGTTIYDSKGNLIPSYKAETVYNDYKDGSLATEYNPDTASTASTPLDTSQLPVYKFETLDTTYAAVEKAPTLSDEYFDLFFYNSTNGRLNLYIPNYAYFQGLVYSHGNFTAAGPLRVIGGVVALDPSSAIGRNINLEDGAMLTTDPEYLSQVFPPYTRSYRVIEWKEIPNP